MMEKEKYERLLTLATSNDKEKSEQLLTRETSRGDLRMWGRIPVDAIGAGDWLLGSWSVDRLRRWIPRMHYYRRKERKFYVVRPDISPAKIELIVDQEDKQLEPQRADFMMENIEGWERELESVAS